MADRKNDKYSDSRKNTAGRGLFGLGKSKTTKASDTTKAARTSKAGSARTANTSTGNYASRLERGYGYSNGDSRYNPYASSPYSSRSNTYTGSSTSRYSTGSTSRSYGSTMYSLSRGYNFDSYGYNPNSAYRSTAKKTTTERRKSSADSSKKKSGLFAGILPGSKSAANKTASSSRSRTDSRTSQRTSGSYDRYGYGGYGNTGYSSYNSNRYSSGTIYSGYGFDSRYNTGYQPRYIDRNSKTNTSTKKTKPKKKSVIGSFVVESAVGVFKSAFGSGGGPVVDLKRNKAALRVYIFIAVLVIVYLIGYTISFCTKTVTNYDTVLYGSVDTPSSYNGVIIRDEKVYKTPAEGVVSYEVSDNYKVKKDEVVCSVRDEDSVLTMEENLDEINENIFKMQQQREDISIYSEDIERVNLQIKNIVDNYAFQFASGDVSGIYELKNSISKKMDNRNQMLLTENKGVLTDLVTQREAAQNKIAENTTYIKAEEGGIVSYYTDGMEEDYSVDKMNTLTKEQTQVKDKTENGFKNTVSADDSVFKLVSSNIWYVAVYMPNEDVIDWEEGDLRNLYVKDNSGMDYTLEAVVESITDTGMEKFMVLRISKDMEAFINNRSIFFETSKPKTGYKIPNSAIVDETSLVIPADYVENGDTVYKVTDGGVEKLTISVSGQDAENNVIYLGLNLGTLSIGDVLRKPGDVSSKYTIEDTMTIKGIYVMNSGIAEFKSINVTNSISNSTHTVLDISINPNINIYDRIITDTSNINKQQKVYS